MKNKCNNCVKFLTCDKKTCSPITYLQANQIEKIKRGENMKFYDKRIYEKDKKIKAMFVILITFLLGIYIGLAINYLEIQEKDTKIRNQYVEIDNLKEIIHRQEMESNV